MEPAGRRQLTPGAGEPAVYLASKAIFRFSYPWLSSSHINSRIEKRPLEYSPMPRQPVLLPGLPANSITSMGAGPSRKSSQCLLLTSINPELCRSRDETGSLRSYWVSEGPRLLDGCQYWTGWPTTFLPRCHPEQPSFPRPESTSTSTSKLRWNFEICHPTSASITIRLKSSPNGSHRS